MNHGRRFIRVKKEKFICRIQPIKGHHQNLHTRVSFSLEDPTIAQLERKKLSSWMGMKDSNPVHIEADQVVQGFWLK